MSAELPDALPDAERIRATIARYAEVFTAADLDGYVDLFAEGATVEDPVGSEVHEGKEAIRAFITQMRAMADEIEFRLTGQIRVAGNEAAFTAEARPVMDGQVMVIPIIDTMVFDADARITRMRAYWDFSELTPG